MNRRTLLKAALGLPATLTVLERAAAQHAGKVKITGFQIRPVSRLAHTYIKIETDAGLTGYGESGVSGPMMHAWRERYKPVLMGKDPLAIEALHMRMATQIHPYMANIPALSGVDMALWDLAGKITGRPVYSLLGGPYRERVPVFVNSAPRDMLDKSVVNEWAAKFKASPMGFTQVKMNTTAPIGKPSGVYSTALDARDFAKIRTAFENVRAALGPNYDIMAHCHNEYDLPSAVGVAKAVEGIQPKWLEDPLPVEFSESWVSLRQQARVPLLTGEKLEMPKGFWPFLQHQVLDFVYPDLAFCGGITGARKIGTLASLYRVPLATHNVGGVLLTMASAHLGHAHFDFLTSETRLGSDNVLDMATNAPPVKEGYITAPDRPGLGVDLSEEGLRKFQREDDGGWV
ncbi:MAG: mandelate racemase/muconate lactonizing enzyme family protein [Bryobacterales bacterium]|nr:mandelate racemase/muconate lactonizing enzyme family protein [Bryobacterales bacterium]